MQISKKLGLTALAGALVLMLAACSGPVESSLNQQTAEQFEAQAAQSASLQMQMMNASFVGSFTNPSLASIGGGSFLAALGVTPQQTDTCTTIVGADDSDVDGDGIPVNADVTIDCSGGEGALTYTLKGSASAQDYDDSNENSGFYLSVDNFQLEVVADGQRAGFSFDGTFDLKIVEGEYLADLNFHLALFGPEGSSSVSYNFDQWYTPMVDGDTDPFDAGTLDFEGDLTFTANDKMYSLTGIGTGLEYNGLGFDAGEAKFKDTAGNSLVITYTPTDYTWEFQASGTVSAE